MNTNIINFEDKKELVELAHTIRAKMAKAEEGLEQARAALLDAGELFLKARALMAEDRAFGHWCREFDDTFSQQEIHALMQLAANREQVERFARHMSYKGANPERWYQATRAMAADMGLSLMKSKDVAIESAVTDMSVTADDCIQESEKPTEQPIEPENKPEKPATKSSSIYAGTSRLAKKIGYEPAKKLNWAFPNSHTHSSLTALALTKGGKSVAIRIANMVDDYLAEPNNIAVQHTAGGKFSHRFFVPDLPKEWTRYHGCEPTNPKAVNAILDETDAAHRMMEALGVGRPNSEYLDWWTKRDQGKAVVTSGPDLSAFSAPTPFTPRIRPALEGEIRVYGRTIWPATETALYSFDEAWAAFKLWESLDKALKTESHQSRGTYFMGLCDYINRTSPAFTSAFRQIGIAQKLGAIEQAEDTFAPHQHLNEV